jgi:hypothetical protein
MEPDPQAVVRGPAEVAGIAIPAHIMGSKGQGQGAVPVFVMAEAEGIGICFGKPVCPVGREGDQIGGARLLTKEMEGK